jgi:hypothetical protein
LGYDRGSHQGGDRWTARGRAALNELDYDEWDKEMVKDFSPGGRGYHLVEKAKRDLAKDKARPIEEGLSVRRKSRP